VITDIRSKCPCFVQEKKTPDCHCCCCSHIVAPIIRHHHRHCHCHCYYPSCRRHQCDRHHHYRDQCCCCHHYCRRCASHLQCGSLCDSQQKFRVRREIEGLTAFSNKDSMRPRSRNHPNAAARCTSTSHKWGKSATKKATHDSFVMDTSLAFTLKIIRRKIT
jgi:hypothetical protein